MFRASACTIARHALIWRAGCDNAGMPHLELFPFRYRDPLTGKWVKARYKAERHEIAARHAANVANCRDRVQW